MTTSSRENLQRALSYIEALERGTTGPELAAFFDPAVEFREYPNRLVPAGATRDLAATLAGAERGKRTVGAQRYAVRSAIADGDTVALEVDWSARLKVSIGSTAAGENIRASFGVFLTFRDGLIVSQRNYDCFEPF